MLNSVAGLIWTVGSPGLVEQGSGKGGGVMQLGSGEFRITGKRVGDCPV